MPQDGSRRLFLIFPKPIYGEYLQTSDSFPQGKCVRSVLPIIFNYNFHLPGHFLQPDPGLAGLHVSRRGLCAGGGAPGVAEGGGGSQGERPGGLRGQFEGSSLSQEDQISGLL